jgi:uncharacterized protein VirK/YbjX
MAHLADYPRLLRQLTRIAPEVVAGTGWRKTWNHVKLMLRGVAYSPWNVRWQDFLRGAAMRPIVEKHPRLILKVQVPYVNRSYRPVRRLEILQAHYRFVHERLSDAFRQRLFFGAPLCLARWDLAPTGTFSLRLGLTVRYWQEGELELALYHEGLQRSCAFLHFSVTGDSEISVGCLQGAKPVEDPGQLSNQEVFSAFKREMHGLRHKSFLLFALRCIAREWSITSIRAVSEEMQLWSEKVRADYNEFWTDEGGTLGADGMYDLPVARTFEDKPRKRSMYQRRNLCLEMLGHEIDETLAHPTRTPELVDMALKEAKSVPLAQPKSVPLSS